VILTRWKDVSSCIMQIEDITCLRHIALSKIFGCLSLIWNKFPYLNLYDSPLRWLDTARHRLAYREKGKVQPN
jgi:hypothetical protein